MASVLDEAATELPPEHPQVSVGPSDRLLPGLRMDVEEFRRRGAVLERAGIDVRAELISGVIHVHPPDLFGHSIPHNRLSTLLGLYAARTPGVAAATEATIRCNDDSEAVADAALLIDPDCRGQVSRRENGLAGVPELVVEVANTSVEQDTITKRALYATAGVREYLVYAVRSARVLAYTRDAGRLIEQPLANGVFRSAGFPGLWIDCGALAAGDLAAAIDTLGQGTATPEHAAFADMLRQRQEEA